MGRWITIDLTGEKIGRLKVIKFVGKDKHNHKLWECMCDCGNVVVATTSNLRGTTKSCGCYNKEKNVTHGMYDTRQYQIWADLKDRCDNPLNQFYRDYGGRGITYPEKWKKFEGFWEDMSVGYDDDLTIDREDNNNSYSKENCRWVDRSIQNHNKRKKIGCKSEYVGVVHVNDKWHARIKSEGKNVHIGTYVIEIEAAKAYDDASEKIYGDRPNKT